MASILITIGLIVWLAFVAHLIRRVPDFARAKCPAAAWRD
jgi:hypothetical protein